MSCLLTYSAISTKVRAMEGRLISDDQFRELCMMDSVRAASDYLSQQPAYKTLFSEPDESMLHRTKIEQQLSLSLSEDFSRLYRFSNLDQRKFLDLYFMNFEINAIKRCLRAVLGHQKPDTAPSAFEMFFNRHSKLNLAVLMNSGNLHEFVANLEGSPYYLLLDQLNETDNPTIFDCEMKLDLLHFRAIWDATEKLLTKSERKLLADSLGVKLDLLNIQWIYRSKMYYHLEAAAIYALLFPHRHRLKKEQLQNMVQSETIEEFYTELRNTHYGRLAFHEQDPPNPEHLYRMILNKLHTDASRKNPYSIASLNSYLYFKEAEIRKIITVIESIRYGIDGYEILSYVNKI